jgi:hypothetical protein
MWVLQGRGPSAEEGGADADAGAALFDGDGEVVGHAHGELGEGGAGGERCVAEAAELAEVGAGLFAGVGEVGGPGWDGHQAGGDEGFERGEGGEQRGEFGGGDAVFGLFVAELDFDEDGEFLVERAARRR